MKTLYADGNSTLHGMKARTKLLALAATGIITFTISSVPVLVVLLVVAGALLFTVRLGWKELRQRLLPLTVTIFVLCGLTMLLQSAEEGIVALFRLTILMLASTAVTATTSIGDVMAEITLAARPLERLGIVRAADIGLAIGLVVRFVPEIAARYAALRDAHAARGLKTKPWTLLAPLIILTLREADDIAAAIDARGVRR